MITPNGLDLQGTIEVAPNSRLKVTASGGRVLSSSPLIQAAGDVSVRADDSVSFIDNGMLGSDICAAADTAWERLRANLLIAEPAGAIALLAAHPSGVFPLLYRVEGNVLRFGTRLSEFASGSEAAPDWAGVAGVLLYGYSLNGRTLLQGVRRLQPGEALICRADGHALRIASRELSVLWSNTDLSRTESLRDRDIDEIWAALVSAIARVGPQCACTLMMSGGWDSRTLLAAMLDVFRAEDILLYSHGNVRSRELRIVDELSQLARCHVHLEPLCAEAFATDTVHRLLDCLGEGFFPHWFRSGSTLRALGQEVAFSGVLGEVLGGHYGLSMVTSGWRKVAAVATHTLGLKDPAASGPAADPRLLLSRGSCGSRPWFISPEAWPTVSEGYSAITSDVEATVARLKMRGASHPESIIEAAVTELRGGQYIGAQPRSLSSHLEIAVPFADYGLLRKLTALPLQQRIHNSLNRRLLLRHNRKLASVPTAASLAPASYPVILQEVTRAIRKLLGGVQERLYSTSGYVDWLKPRLSWVDFECLRNDTALELLLAELSSPIWNGAELRSVLTRSRQKGGPSSMHPVTDMLLKIVTIDRAISHRYAASQS